MGILLFIFCFIFIFLSFLFIYAKKGNFSDNLRLSFLKSSLVISFLVVLITEILSHFDAITRVNILISWFFVWLISLISFILLFNKNQYSFKSLNLEQVLLIRKESLTTKTILLLVLIATTASFIIALTINNNWDSYTYHLPRVEHWIQDKNVDFYPTNNIRQLYLAPFSEYFILNTRLLSANVLFINFVQFFAMINCLIIVSLIAKLFSLSSKWQLFSIVLVLTLPMGILQSVTTQTDYLVSFFLIAFIYFSLLLIKDEKISYPDLFFLSVSSALGILTKATFYIWAFPFCIFFGIFYLKTFKIKSVYVLFFLVLIFFIINFSFFSRNYQQFGSPLGPQKTSPYYLPNLNEEFGIKPMLSNSVKNIGLHLALPNDNWNAGVDRMINIIHEDLIKFPLNYSKTNWFNINYKTSFTLHHDLVGNFIHIILFFIVIIAMVFRLKIFDKLVIFYGSALVASFLFFSFLLKWQPWQTRLDLPFFIVLSPLIAYAFSKLKFNKISTLLSFILLFITISILFIFDPSKTIFGKNSVFIKNNINYIFNYAVAKKIEFELYKYNISNIGLALGDDSWEWQYWLLSKNRRFEYVYFLKDLVSTPNFDPGFKYRALILDVPLVIENKENIVESINFDEKTTLIIYKTAQDRLFINGYGDNSEQKLKADGANDSSSTEQSVAVDQLAAQYQAALAEGIDFKKCDYPTFLSDVSGMSNCEDWGRWTNANNGPSAKFRFKQPLPERFKLEIEIRDFFGLNAGQPVKVTIGNIEQSFVLNKTDHTYNMAFEKTNGADTIDIAPAKSSIPTDSDPRRMGLGLISLRIRD